MCQLCVTVILACFLREDLREGKSKPTLIFRLQVLQRRLLLFRRIFEGVGIKRGTGLRNGMAEADSPQMRIKRHDVRFTCTWIKNRTLCHEN
jgi:hypothetical protein